MNIKNFTPRLYTFTEIFAKQKEIKFQYEPESKEIFAQFDIDTFEDQEIFKKYCWRITEELMEALEDQKNEDHFREELIDGFNFMVELYLLYGWTWDDREFISDKELDFTQPHDQILKIIYQLGITANLLKNRQWRRSQYLVDIYLFEPRLKQIWVEYMRLFYCLGMDNTEIKSLWSLKYQVNLFRLQTNY